MGQAEHPKIIVLCPLAKTGGPEALHQLVHVIRREKLAPAFIHYIPDSGSNSDVVKKYYAARYDIEEIPAAGIRGNVLVFPEFIDPQLARSYHAEWNWVWWLSMQRKWPLHDYEGIGNLCQSHYAASSLRIFGGTCLALSDYIAEEYKVGTAPVEKEDVIVIGPKSLAYVFTLRKMLRGLRIVPLINLSPEEVRRWLCRAKIYLDFGWHPGRDRMPREAALCDCLVVTNRLGAAADREDLPIDEQYKISRDKIVDAPGLLKELLQNYSQHSQRFAAYKQWISGDTERFTNEVRQFVGQCRNPGAFSAAQIDPEVDSLLMLYQEECLYYRGQVQSQVKLLGLLQALMPAAIAAKVLRLFRK